MPRHFEEIERLAADLFTFVGGRDAKLTTFLQKAFLHRAHCARFRQFCSHSHDRELSAQQETVTGLSWLLQTGRLELAQEMPSWRGACAVVEWPGSGVYSARRTQAK